MNLSYYIAQRYLISKKSHNAITIISLVSIVGVSIGTMALIVVLSAFNGLSDLVKSLYNSFNADMEITLQQGKVFQLADSTINQLKNIKGVMYYTEILEENALLKYKNQQCLATVRGVSEQFLPMSRFDTLVRDGKYNLNDNTRANAVIGRGICYQLNVNPSDPNTPIVAFVPRRGFGNAVNPDDAFNKKNIFISGMFSINDDFDYKYALVSIQTARDLLEYTNELSAIDLGIQHGSNPAEVASSIKSIVGDKFIIKNKFQQNELLFKTLKSEKLWTFIILLFIMVIATFNVIGSLTMLIIEKKQDMRILWDMGADKFLIRKIFLIEGVLITLIGVGVGLFLGTVICLGQQHFEWVKFNDSFVVSAYPVKLLLTDYLLVFGSVLLIGLVAAWYPVRLFTNRYFSSKRLPE